MKKLNFGGVPVLRCDFDVVSMFLKLERDLHFGYASCDATKNRLYFGAESRFKFAVVACGAFHHCLQPAKDAELEENENKRMHYRGIEPSILWRASL